MIIRLAPSFNVEVEVPDGSKYDVSVQEAKDAVEGALSFYLDDTAFRDCWLTYARGYSAEDIT